ncbi:MAG: hypothetical protein K1X72_21315 [Pyrinomonadaceae bacterium]|nr:hypothetical protein [Pyrinomonadaceae bacterium]
MNRIFQFSAIFCLFAISVFAQTVVINDPTAELKNNSGAEIENLIKAKVLPKVRKHWVAEDSPCQEAFEMSGAVKGSFSKPDSNQTLAFYSFCQTGNGFGNNGLALIEDGKVIANYLTESGWTLGITVLPDINQNGLNEFALYYSGGMHQGQGGTGVDIFEFSGANLKGIGWFNAESFTETTYFGYKVTAKKGKTPIFYREKYNNKNDKWRKAGNAAPFKLTKVYSQFEILK